MRRAGQFVGAVVLLVGVFWAGRESSHGLSAFGDHWWCPVPLVFIFVGLVGFLLGQRAPQRT